jgi:type VI secretion system protein VasG
VDEVAKRCTEVESGARNVDNILTNTLLPEISQRLLAAMAAGEGPKTFHVAISDDGSLVYQ